MKGINSWSYAPYTPLLFDSGDIYISRVVPSEYGIHFEWLKKDGCNEYSVYYRERETKEFILAGTTKNIEYDIENLETKRDYEFYVQSGEQKSRVRLARCGKSIGSVVNYLHPDDKCYSFSGNCLCSPSLVRHPDGFLLASMDLFDFDTPQNLTLIFRSDDDGKTWHYVSELYPSFWGKMFIHKGILYMLSCSTEYGDLLIGASYDGGKTFGQPTVILRGSCQGNVPGVHKNPQNVVKHKGRIYETLEWGAWRHYFAPMVISCDENDDLLNAENWHITPPLKYDPNWEGVAKGYSHGNIEGTLVEFPDGNLYNVMRYDMSCTVPNYGLVLAYKVNTDDPDAPLEYSHAIEFPANNSKFMIKKDTVTNRYYTIATRISDEKSIGHRDLLSLMYSEDMKNWTVACDLYDYRGIDPQNIGLQYADFEIEGDDIIFLLRTAMNNARGYHDSNYSTFHKIKNFRNI